MAKLGSPLGMLPVTGMPCAGRAKQGRNKDRQGDDDEPDGLTRQKARAKQEQRDRHEPDRQNDPMDIAELAEEPDQAIEEIVPTAGDPEEAGQLRHDDGEPGAGLEANQNAVADQAHQHAEPEDPGNQAQDRHGKGRHAGNLRVSDRIACRQRPDRARDHQRDRRGRTNRKLTRRAQQRVADAAQHVAIDADLRRQAGERRVGKRHRNRVSRQRHAADDVGRQPGGAISGEPVRRREEFSPARCHVGHLHRAA